MKHIYIITILLVLFCSSCQEDTVSKLFIEHIKTEYNFEITNTETIFIIYAEKGCNSCNKEIESFLDNNKLPENCFILYLEKYPNKERYEMWNSKFFQKLYLDRTDFFGNLDIDLNGSGRIVLKNRKIIEVKTFNPQENSFEKFLVHK